MDSKYIKADTVLPYQSALVGTIKIQIKYFFNKVKTFDAMWTLQASLYFVFTIKRNVVVYQT